MKSTSLLPALSVLVLPSLALSSTLKYNPIYSTSSNDPLDYFACSDGGNGLTTRYGVATIPRLMTKLKPGVGLAAAPLIAAWNSPNCGVCYKLMGPSGDRAVFVVGIDSARPDQWAVGPESFRWVSPTGTTQEGTLEVHASEMPPSECWK